VKYHGDFLDQMVEIEFGDQADGTIFVLFVVEVLRGR
jgi:hypothetical protein